MTPQELKNSILQLAIQGKLVEQRPEEGTAEELYKQIQAEKKALIKAGKIKKEKPLPEITEDEIPFEIPDSWKWMRYSDLFDIGSAIRIHQTDWKTEGIPFFRGRELVRLAKTGNPDAEIFISRELYELNKEKGGVPQKGDLLVTAVGTLGKVYIVKGTQPFYYKDAYILRYNNFFKLFSDYFKYVIEAPFIQEYIAQGSMGTTVAQLTIEKAKRMLCPFPPLAEQKRIVAKIEELLPLIERYEKAWSRLEDFNKRFPGDMQKSILQMAIQGKLVEQRPEEGTGEELYEKIQAEKQALIKTGKIKKEKPLPEITEDEIPFEIPESWKWVRWGDLSESIQYGYNAPAQESGRIKMVRISDIQDGRVLWDSVPYCEISEKDIPTYLLSANDILFARTGGTVGKSYLVKDVPEESIYAGYLIRTRYSGHLCPEYMKYFMESQLYWDQLHNGTIATAQPNCNGKTLSRMILPLPPLAEQKRIVARLEELLPLCEKLK